MMSRTILSIATSCHLTKRITFITLTLLTLLTFTLTTLFILKTTTLASASTITPDPSCFQFDADTGSITNYWDTEGNVGGAPACPRNVNIPSQIGGVDVVAVSGDGFGNKALTAVTLPDTLITITGGAFLSNQLTEITIPDSVTTITGAGFNNNTSLTKVVIGNGIQGAVGGFTFNGAPLEELTIGTPDYTGPATALIGYGGFTNKAIHTLKLGPVVSSIGSIAFQGNQLTTVTIPASVTAIGNNAFFDNNLTQVTIHGNPTLNDVGIFGRNGLDKSTIPSGLTTAQQYQYYQDNAELVRIHATNPAFIAANQDTFYTNTASGSTFVTSGYLINSASYTLQYVNSANTDISVAQTFIGSNPWITDYKLANILDDSDTENPTLDFDSGNYYRIGDTITITPPSIDGYVTPEPQALTLDQAFVLGDSILNLTYYTQEELDALVEGNGDNATGTAPGVPATGVGSLLSKPFPSYWLVGGVLILLSGVVLIHLRKTVHC